MNCSPVNVLSFSRVAKATLGRTWNASIDRRPLLDLIEAAFPKRHWPDKSRALLRIAELQKSASASGSFPLLVCANCATSGYETCEDVGLAPVEVVHDDATVSWTIRPADWVIPPSAPIVLRFHKPQYRKAVAVLQEGTRHL